MSLHGSEIYLQGTVNASVTKQKFANTDVNVPLTVLNWRLHHAARRGGFGPTLPVCCHKVEQASDRDFFFSTVLFSRTSELLITYE